MDKIHWEVDDTVYYLKNNPNWGGMPLIAKGTVEEITRDTLRIKDQDRPEDKDYLLIMHRCDCYKDIASLLVALTVHINQETQKLEGTVYDG